MLPYFSLTLYLPFCLSSASLPLSLHYLSSLCFFCIRSLPQSLYLSISFYISLLRLFLLFPPLFPFPSISSPWSLFLRFSGVFIALPFLCLSLSLSALTSISSICLHPLSHSVSSLYLRSQPSVSSPVFLPLWLPPLSPLPGSTYGLFVFYVSPKM